MKRIAITVSFVLLLCAEGKAQFGIPQIVYDPAIFGKELINVQQGLRTYFQILQAYQLAVQMSQAIERLPYEYQQALVSQWRLMSPASCPNCGTWAQAANTGM